jgi:tubulin-specific chaperone C
MIALFCVGVKSETSCRFSDRLPKTHQTYNYKEIQFPSSKMMRKTADAAQDFWISFQGDKQSLSEAIDNIFLNEGDVFKLKQRVVKLQQKLTDASNYLPAYDVRSTTLQLKELHDRVVALEPKREKFSFSRKSKTVMASKAAKPIVQKLDVDTLNASPLNAYILTNVSNKVIIPTTTQTDMTIEKIDGCVIILSNLTPTSLYLRNITNSVIICKQVSGSLYCDDITNSIITGSSVQLRIHQCQNVHLHVSVSSNAIIEDCTGMGFGIYPFGGDEVKLPKVDDFNWLQKTSSPNWRYVEYVPHWPSTYKESECLVGEEFEHEKVAGVVGQLLALIK